MPAARFHSDALASLFDATPVPEVPTGPRDETNQPVIAAYAAMLRMQYAAEHYKAFGTLPGFVSEH